MWRPHTEFVTEQACPDFYIAVCLLTHRGTISHEALRSPHWGHSVQPDHVRVSPPSSTPLAGCPPQRTVQLCGPGQLM